MTQSIAPKTGDRLILRGADGYDEARFARVFNARRPERYPAAVLVPESVPSATRTAFSPITSPVQAASATAMAGRPNQ